MNNLKADMKRIQELVGGAFTSTGALVALADGGKMGPEKLQQTLERTSAEFEKAVLALRVLCERYSPGTGGYGAKPALSVQEVAGTVEVICFDWLHIRLNTMLPHCRYQSPAWLTDTLRRLLDGYEERGGRLPRFERAALVIDEHCDIAGRRIFDQDNKGWKAVSNALKGRLIPDDDQYTLSVILTAQKSSDNQCHILLMDLRDASDFFSLQYGECGIGDVYARG